MQTYTVRRIVRRPAYVAIFWRTYTRKDARREG
jgi:hypothetical protein